MLGVDGRTFGGIGRQGGRSIEERKGGDETNEALVKTFARRVKFGLTEL